MIISHLFLINYCRLPDFFFHCNRIVFTLSSMFIFQFIVTVHVFKCGSRVFIETATQLANFLPSSFKWYNFAMKLQRMEKLTEIHEFWFYCFLVKKFCGTSRISSTDKLKNFRLQGNFKCCSNFIHTFSNNFEIYTIKTL